VIFGEILARLSGVGRRGEHRAQALCRAYDDKQPSPGVTQAGDGSGEVRHGLVVRLEWEAREP